MKHRAAAVSIALLTLGLALGAAAFAAEPTSPSPETPATSATDEVQTANPQVEPTAPRPPLQSTDEIETQVDPSRELFNEKIRACTWSEEQQCGSGCACLFVSNTVRCFC